MSAWKVQINLTVPESVLERLIASGALSVSDVCCQGLEDKRRISDICKRCCARPLGRKSGEGLL